MFKNLPDVLSFQRGTIVSDGIFTNAFAAQPRRFEPLRVIRHGIRGISAKEDGDISNIQRTESAKTLSDAIGFDVNFSYRSIAAQTLLFSCSDPEYRQSAESFVAVWFRRGVPEFDEVCRRYARNILNGRWLWRNRILGEISVTAQRANDEQVFSGAGSRLHDFKDYTQDEQTLADLMASGIETGADNTIQVTGSVRFATPGAIEVFPSQNMVTSKPEGFARSLYRVNPISRSELSRILGSAKRTNEDAGEFTADMIVMGDAALRDQKIGNAIRTIDTWYPDFIVGQSPILSIEPNGESLAMNKKYRAKKAGSKDLLKRIDEIRPAPEFNGSAAYLCALLVRGGVFSEGNKDKPKKGKEPAEQDVQSEGEDRFA